MLLLHANRVVSTDSLIDALWEDRTRHRGEGAAGACLHLRRLLGPDRLETRAPGYVLRVAEG